jgi:Tfp pilus assembly protein PilO
MTVKEARPRLRIALVVLLAVALAAVAVLLSPLSGFRSTRQQDYEQVRLAWQEERRKALPLRDIDKKIDDARLQVSEFYRTRLPARDSAIPEELGKLAAANGVRFSGIRYASEEAGPEGVRQVQINASLAGDYVKVVKFINALERDETFFIVNSVSLIEQQGGNVRLELHLETYLRNI